MHDNLAFYNNLVTSFAKQAYTHEKLEGNRNKLNITYPDTQEECSKRIIYYFDTLNISDLEPSKSEKEKIKLDFLRAQSLYIHMTQILEERASGVSNILFIRLIACQIYVNSFMVDYDSNLEFYYTWGLKVVEYVNEFPDELEKTELAAVIFLKRCLYLSDHNSHFNDNKNMYNRCVKLVSDDAEYSRKRNKNDYIKALLNYITISFDHLSAAIGREDKYVSYKSLDVYEKSVSEYIVSHVDAFDDLEAFRIYSSLFKLKLLRLKEDFHNRKVLSQKGKGLMLTRCSVLICLFFGEIERAPAFFDPPPEEDSFPGILQDFSRQLARLLTESSLNTSEPLFLVFQFLSFLPEYKKLNHNIYKRLAFVSKEYYNRKIYVLSNLLYIKSLDEEDVFNREVGKIKRYIQEKPLTSLITLYNSEINLLPRLQPARRKELFIDHHIVDIFHEVKKMEQIIKLQIVEYRENNMGRPDFREKNILLTLFGNDLKNTLVIAADSTLCNNLTATYSAMVDKYIDHKKMDFRDDLKKELKAIKMSIAEVNPLHIAGFLMIYKLGKALRIISCKDMGKLQNRSVLDETPDEVKKYITQIETYFSKNSLPIHADRRRMVSTLKEIGELALSGRNMISVEARLIRIVLKFLKDVLDYKANKAFISGYYDDIHVSVRKEWEIDPVMVYFFNEYLASKSFLLFKNYLTGEKIYFQGKLFASQHILDVIYGFISDLSGRQEQSLGGLTNELEEISRLNSVNLLDDEGKRREVTFKTVKEYVVGKKTVYLDKTCINKKDLIYLNEIINLLLIYVGKKNAAQTLFYVIRSIIINAHKGNIKRAFFHEKELDIKISYSKGIEAFTFPLDETELVPILEKLGLSVRIEVMAVKDVIIISVINAYELTVEESELVNERVILAQEIESLQEAYGRKLATGEGEGLGLIVSFLLLKKLGLGTDNFKVESSAGKTCCKIILPITDIKEKDRHSLAEEIAREVENIPMIPDNIQRLRKMVKDESVELVKIEEVILKDPSLSAIILKTANSAFYSPANKIETILDGIKILGTRGVDNLLIIFGAYKLLEKKNDRKRIEKIIEHSEKTAFYVKELITFKGVEAELDDIYLPALLHDIGKLIIEGLHPDLYAILEKFERVNNIPKEVIEDLMGGLYHDLVGYHLAKKWNFPDIACTSIKYHHFPRETDSFFDEVFTIYLANVLIYFNENKLVYENIDSNVLNYFEVRGQEQLSIIASEIEQKYVQLMGAAVN